MLAKNELLKMEVKKIKPLTTGGLLSLPKEATEKKGTGKCWSQRHGPVQVKQKPLLTAAV